MWFYLEKRKDRKRVVRFLSYPIDYQLVILILSYQNFWYLINDFNFPNIG